MGIYKGDHMMSRYSYKTNLKALIQKNIKDLQKDSNLMERIEEKIEDRHLKEDSKLVVMEK